MEWSPEADWTGQLQALLDHTWNGGFNFSSEHHEGASWYGMSQGVHPDLHPVERWEQASATNDAFALGVSWKPAALNVGEIAEALLEEQQQTMSAAAAGPTRRKKSPGLVSRFMNFILKA